MARIGKTEKGQKQMQDTFNAIVALTDTFCTAQLDEEYAHLAHQATAALCRQRSSPPATGHVQTWTCVKIRLFPSTHLAAGGKKVADIFF